MYKHSTGALKAYYKHAEQRSEFGMTNISPHACSLEIKVSTGICYSLNSLV